MSDKTISSEPHYCAANSAGWSVEMLGTEAQDGSDTDYSGSFGMPITNFTIEALGIKKYRVRNKRGKWLPYKTGYDKANESNTTITAIEIVGEGFIVGVHVKGGSWLDPVITSKDENTVVIGGNSPIDAIWVNKL